MGGLSRQADSPRNPLPVWAIGLGVMALVTILMAWDHLWGNEPGTREFPVDLPTFVVSMLISVVCAALIFSVLIPRTRPAPGRAPRRALWLSGLSAPLVVVAGWLGFPFVMAGGGIALAMIAPPRSRLARYAIALGGLVLAFGIVATAFPTSDS